MSESNSAATAAVVATAKPKAPPRKRPPRKTVSKKKPSLLPSRAEESSRSTQGPAGGIVFPGGPRTSTSQLAARRSSVRKLVALGGESTLSTANEKKNYAVSCVRTVVAGAPSTKDVAFGFSIQRRPEGTRTVVADRTDQRPPPQGALDSSSFSSLPQTVVHSATFRGWVPHPRVQTLCFACRKERAPAQWVCLPHAPASWGSLCEECSAVFTGCSTFGWGVSPKDPSSCPNASENAKGG